MKRLLLFFCSALLLASCEKEDTAVTLPKPGPVTPLQANMGVNYDNQIYISLSSNTQFSVPCKGYDLAFEASASGMHIYLNGAKLMFATRTATWDLAVADTIGAKWRVDQEQLNPDSTALGNWWDSIQVQNGQSRVFIIDRGYATSAADRFRKFKVLSADAFSYTVMFSKLNNTNQTVVTIPKDAEYSLMYLDFGNGGKVVKMAPKKSEWDFVFTRYTHVYFDEPVGSIYRHYTVSGGVLNIWNGVQGFMMRKDSIPNYTPFDSCDYAATRLHTLESRGDVIGFNWKYYDFNNSRYYVYPNLYFVLQDKAGFMYKLRIIDFYDQQGNKGNIALEYQRL